MLLLKEYKQVIILEVVTIPRDVVVSKIIDDTDKETTKRKQRSRIIPLFCPHWPDLSVGFPTSDL